MTRDVLVISPTHKCSIDFKVRGRLAPRKVKTLQDGSLRVRVGNQWRAVYEISEHAPLRLVVPRGTAQGLPGFRDIG
jgi:hypothetical protein